MSANPFVEFQQLYGPDCAKMAREVLGFEPDEDQAAIMASYDAGERSAEVTDPR